jgi:hypothetical protein
VRRIYVVARQFQLVGRLLNAFNYGDVQCLSQAVSATVKEAEHVFSVAYELVSSTNEEERAKAGAACDRAEHLVRVVARLVEREAPKSAANREAWVARHAR